MSLSAQQLVDCTMDNYGCAGGSRFRAIRYLISNGGIATEAAYPYEARVSDAFLLIPSFYTFHIIGIRSFLSYN